MIFVYGEKETGYLKSRDKALGDAIDKIGPIQREVDVDLFSAVVRCMIGQLISSAAGATLWSRMREKYGELTAHAIAGTDTAELQKVGMTFKKAEYIKDFAKKIVTGELALDSLGSLRDDEVIKEFCKLKGIGVWTAEMVMIFGMQRPDVLSFGDLAIHRGLRMLYHQRKVDRVLFEKYRRRYSPYGTVASLYLWAIAAGALPGMRDHAPKKGRRAK